ncbi:MAG: UDP-N-acetylmuramoyl-L-alanyl-D-glutamate--2,6-diaminopimelate ligase [Candidatus Wildermuthbacteria bacterium]|nr:UDP-N-acetylmuramoyl-L-alanyl-D-glutamate--2,6-diaminopimelate ligase [Candidatus Wildermuthbacteria bacterium]
MKRILKKIFPPFILSWYHFVLAFVAAAWYRFPSRDLTVIGVTGTNGKSTTVDMISRIFAEAGIATASLSSIRFQINEKEWRNTLKMTMPGPFFAQRFLRKAVNAGCTHAVTEVTSEGILQYRHRFIKFHTAVFTNLSPEHIERHGSFEHYRQAKGGLFQAAQQVHITNGDDKNSEYFLQFAAREKWIYGLKNSKSEIRNPKQIPNTKYQILNIENIQIERNGVEFFVKGTEFHLKLLGEFNAYNALAAICVGLSQNIPLETCKNALENIEKVPGRMELIIQKPFWVFVDYAFTPNALEKVYRTLKELQHIPNTKLVCVLGAAGGGRDKWKRPVLGRIAASYCDKIIVTNEDPYDENPTEIIEQVAEGAGEEAEKILDRREAIGKALHLAGSGDVVVITGKGSEDSIDVAGGKKIPWDDREVVREEFRKIHSQETV